VSLRGTRLWREAAGNCDCCGGDGVGKGGGMDKKIANLANVRQKEKREDRDNADKRGGLSPVRRSGNSDRGAMRG
jgi:hypothetical protein